MKKVPLLFLCGALVVGLAFTGGLLSKGDLLGNREPAINNPFLTPYPEDELTDRELEVVAREVLAEDLALTQGKTRYFEAKLPEELLGIETFVSVTARVRVQVYSRQLLVVSDGDNVSQSAPVSARKRWQAVTVAFPFQLTKGEFTIAIDGSQPVEVKELVFLALVDDRYERDVCTETEQVVGHEARRYADYHEHLAYRKSPDRLRIAFVGNSTIDGCKVGRGATPSYVLQQKLEALYPGQFEVMNLGIAGASYVSHITSITTYYPLQQHFWPSIEEAARFQNRQPSAADLDVDILVLAVHWNDLSDFRFLAYGGESPTEGEQMEGRSYADSALDAYFDVLDDPSAATLYRLLMSYRTMTSQPIVRDRWKDYARSHYRHLTERYIERLVRYSPETKVVLLTLPNDQDIEDATRFEADIQRDVYLEAAAKRELPIIDLAGFFRSRFPKRSARRQYASAYLFTDPIHFSYKGNQWLADNVSRTILAVAGGEVGR